MEKPERGSFTTLDFISLQEIGALELSPKFQRREVWKTPARSYFIDSILQDIPVPPIFLRTSQSGDKKKTVREVIDGQQRLRAVLDFVADKYALTRSAVKQHGGKRFSEIDSDSQEKILNYSFACEKFQNLSDPEVLEIFARVNTYSVRLNAQELRNGKFFGLFKRLAYSLAHEHVEFWRRHRIFSEGNIARMDEVELTSELMIAQLDGQQDKKKSIDQFYTNYDETFDEKSTTESNFRTTVDTINDALADDLGSTEFRRSPLFYTLYCSTYHRLFGLPKESTESPRKGKLLKKELSGLKDAVLNLSDKIVAAKNEQDIARKDISFINSCLRQTDNIKPREIRLRRLYTDAFSSY